LLNEDVAIESGKMKTDPESEKVIANFLPVPAVRSQ
jgi:hypothetical protein